MTEATQNVGLTDADLEAILADEALTSLEELVALDAETEADPVEALSDAVGEIESEEAVAQAYKDQEGSTESDAPATPGKAPAKKGTRMNTAGMKPSDVVRAKMGTTIHKTFITALSDARLPDADLNALIDGRVNAIDGLPKKVGEKVINVLQHLSSGVTISCFTRMALDLLKSKGTISTKDIRDAYLKRPYSAGTSNAQSSQMMAVLPFLGIATKSGNTLTIDQDSALISLL